MGKWADYCISKQTLVNGWIDSIVVYKDLGDSLDSNVVEVGRAWMVNQVTVGKTFCSIRKNDNGKWKKIGDYSYNGRIFSWHGSVPKNSVCHKVFVSFYHKDDQEYREKFENLFEDLIISKSVDDGDIDSDTGDEYIKQLIQRDYLTDTSVMIVLIGPKTKCRKHIDWEISGAITSKVGGNSGLIGILLPSHPDYGENKKYNSANIPFRLSANVDSGYAALYDWTNNRVDMQNWVEKAYERRTETEKKKNSGEGLNQMEEDTCS